MKNILTIIILLITLSSMFSQTKLDSVVFEKVNEYRISKGFKSLGWDITCYKAAKVHTNYLFRTGKVGHKEDTLVDPKDRLRYVDSKGKWTIINEVAISTNINIKDDSIDKIAILIVNGWKNSKLHNDVILDSVSLFSGVECILKIRPQGLKDVYNYQVISTMVIVGGIYRNL